MNPSTKTTPLYPIISDTPPFTLEVPGVDPIEGESIPRRNSRYVDELLTQPEEGIATVFDIVTRAARVFGNARAVGTRKLLKTHNETKKVTKVVDGREQQVDKKWTYFELSGYNYLSFIEYEQQVLQVGAGLRKLGLVRDDRLFLFAGTSARWLMTAHGAVSQSMPFVTAYDTLGEEAIRLSLLATEPKVVFLDPQLIPILSKTLKGVKSVKTVIYNNEHEMKPEDLDKLKSAHGHLEIFSYEELRQLGETNLVDPVPPNSGDLCCIMYTSGSIGPPKGVLIKHRNIVGAVAGLNAVVGAYIGPADSLMSYLPLAHIFEFALENAALFWGTLLGYGTAKTLSDTSMKNCKGDIRELQPTLMVGVPAVWEQIRKGVVARVEQQSFIAKNIFWAAFAAKSWMLKMGLPGWGMWDATVFGKVREATGGRLRMTANGAGPISKDTQRFLSLVVAPMISGYGMTETCGMGSLGSPMRWTDDAIGDIPACIEVKLVDYPEAGYYSHSKLPQGEIWIRGTAVLEGYYKDDEQTAEALTPDGWLMTGDIGEWNKNGHLKIIDRKKNLVKTMNGEYIALEKLESIYRSSPLISNVCVYASPNHAKPIAIIVPAEPAMKDLADSNSIAAPNGLKDLINNEKFQDIVLREVQATGRKGGLNGIELVSGLVLVHEEWTPQNRLLTSALKLNRRKIVETYKKDVEKVYAKNP